MKITYLHQYFNTPEMSGSTRSFEFGRRLVNMGHEVNIITSWRTSKKKQKWFKTNEKGINVYWIPVPYSNNMKFFERIKAFIKFAIYSSIKSASIKSDIIFATSTPLTIVLPGVYASKKHNVPFVLEVRDVWPQVPIALNVLRNPFLIFLGNILEKWAYKKAHSIVALSPTMKNEIVSKNVNSNCVAVIPNSCDIDKFASYKNSSQKLHEKFNYLKGKPFLLYAGTFGKVNHLSYAINMAEALLNINSNINILLIGDGIEKNSLVQEAINKKVYKKNLFIESKIAKNEIFSLFCAATMCANFVIDKKEAWANSANKFFDALAAGKPILLNHGGWMQDLLTFYDCGLCVYGKSIKNVALEVNSSMNDLEWLKKTGNNSTKLAQNFFDRDLLAKKLESVLVTTKAGNNDKIEKIASGIYI